VVVLAVDPADALMAFLAAFLADVLMAFPAGVPAADLVADPPVFLVVSTDGLG
jgi:hypothetical protein